MSIQMVSCVASGPASAARRHCPHPTHRRQCHTEVLRIATSPVRSDGIHLKNPICQDPKFIGFAEHFIDQHPRKQNFKSHFRVACHVHAPLMFIAASIIDTLCSMSPKMSSKCMQYTNPREHSFVEHWRPYPPFLEQCCASQLSTDGSSHAICSTHPYRCI